MQWLTQLNFAAAVNARPGCWVQCLSCCRTGTGKHRARQLETAMSKRPAPRPDNHPLGRVRFWLAALALSALSACGGGGNGDVSSCDVVSRQSWLRDYFNDWYFWYALSPYPTPGSLPTVDAYFNGLLYTGIDPNFPADRWSFHQSTESFNRFFGDGQTLSYGISVAGLEVTGQPTEPLYVRYIEPQSPAVGKVFRGDRIVSINGRPAADMISRNDFSVLAPNASGDRIQVVLLDTVGQQFTVDVAAAVFPLTPVPSVPSRIVTSPAGKKMGYLMVKDMISQAGGPLADSFQSFAAAGVTELVLDLRYNVGGLVTVGRDIASYLNPARTAGQIYTSLLYNNKRAGQFNTSVLFTSPPNALTLTRVYVLQGARTASASEQLVNALRPFLVDVVLIGDTTFGKPVGFLPTDDACGETYNVVNFEAVNANLEGRYFDGFAPRCAVAEDFTVPLGSLAEPLLAAARNHADGIGCPTLVAPAREQTQSARIRAALRKNPEGEHPAMIPR
jgi:hypothetical protein